MAGLLRRSLFFVTVPLLLFALRTATGPLGASPTIVLAHADKKLEGAELFGASGCTHCHGVEGNGTDRGPSLRQLRKKLKPEQITEQIKHGGKEMPAFGDSLDDGQIAELVAFLDARKWQTVPPAPAFKQ